VARNDSLKFLPLSEIRENPSALRPVNKKAEEYTGLVDSIKNVGVMNPITVREMRDTETGVKYYSLVDGLHRYNAAQDAGLTEIPVHVLNLDEVGTLEAQLMANIHKVETRPVEFSKHLTRIFGLNPLMTTAELATKLAVSPSFISQRLGLVKLDDSVAKLVDDGSINVSNAYSLAKLPKENQADFIERAITMPPAEFGPTVNARAKEIRDAKRQGREPSHEFVAIAHLRKLNEIREEATKAKIGSEILKTAGIRKPEEAWELALKWALQIDPQSIEIAKQKFEMTKKQEEADKAARKKEREEKRAVAAAEKQAAAKQTTAPATA
jgi:ParB/RepB/Spo0J family partition protein